MTQVLLHPKALHSPTLETVQMVETTLKEAKEVLSIAEIKRRLPRKVNHNTLKVILSYLQQSGKIEFTLQGAVWVFMPKEDIAAILSKGRTWI
jgi:DNA-binding TFAR19-related protein (PDSD5 family)